MPGPGRLLRLREAVHARKNLWWGVGRRLQEATGPDHVESPH